MKFYKRFPGDIQIKTGGLTLAEFGAYDRLLDHYYATEEPILPNEVYSISRALTRADREAVDKVLRKFFVLDALGYTQERADEMIAEAQPKIEAARANGVKGGRPKKNQNKTQQKPNGFTHGTEDEPNAKTSQSQSSLSPSEKRTARKRAAPVEVVGLDVMVEAGFTPELAAEFIACKAQRKAPLTPYAWRDHLRESQKAGWSPVAAAEKVMGKTWLGFEAKYVADEARPGAQAAKSFRERDAEIASARVYEMTGGVLCAAPSRGEIIDMEPSDGALTSLR